MWRLLNVVARRAAPYLDCWLGVLALALAGIALVLTFAMGWALGLLLGLALIALLGWGAVYRGIGWVNEREYSDRLRDHVLHAEKRMGQLTSRIVYEDFEVGLGNDALLRLEWRRAVARHERLGEPFSIVMVRLEPETRMRADECLVAVARHTSDALLFSARTEDTVCRLDATNFAVLLSDTRAEAASRFAERIELLLANRPPNIAGHHQLPRIVTACADWQGDMKDLDDLVAAGFGESWTGHGLRQTHEPAPNGLRSVADLRHDVARKARRRFSA